MSCVIYVNFVEYCLEYGSKYEYIDIFQDVDFILFEYIFSKKYVVFILYSRFSFRVLFFLVEYYMIIRIGMCISSV